MPEEQVIDVEPSPNMALATREKPQPPAPFEHRPMDATQARVEHVATLLASAYAKASTLQLAPEESAKLVADFPDSDICTGAGGDSNLLYIQHGSIRRRLAQVFGPGQWSLINRRTWLDEAQGFMYADCVLVIRGCYVGEAIGAQRWTPKNARMNYSDANEGAQSEALRRIAGKYLDCGIQVWDKHFCEGWKARQRNAPQQPQRPFPVAKPSVANSGDEIPMDFPPKEEPKPEPKKELKATAETRNWMIGQFDAKNINMEAILAYARDAAILLPTEKLKDWPLDKVPTSKAALEELCKKIEAHKAKAQPESAADDQRLKVVGVIECVSSKNGKTKGKEWTLFGVKVDNEWYNTFSSTIGGEAEKYKAEGGSVTLFYELDGQSKTIVEIVPPEVTP